MDYSDKNSNKESFDVSNQWACYKTIEDLYHSIWKQLFGSLNILTFKQIDKAGFKSFVDDLDWTSDF